MLYSAEIHSRKCFAVKVEDDVHHGGFIGGAQMRIKVFNRTQTMGHEERVNNCFFFSLKCHVEAKNDSLWNIVC